MRGKKIKTIPASNHPVHSYTQRVYYGDTDCSGFVYHARYLDFFERARTELLRSCGFDYASFAKDELVFVVRHLRIQYYQPARMDDNLHIASKITKLTAARLVLNQPLFKEEKNIVEAELELALVNTAGRPSRLPSKLLQAFLQYTA